MSNQSSPGGVVNGCSESTQPDYSSVDIPTKPTTEYHYVERRAELLQLIRQAGHPALLEQNQRELADRYGVSQQTISKDFSRLSEHVNEALGDRRALEMRAVFNKCVSELLEEGEWRDAARTQREFVEWVAEYQDVQDVQERLERLEAQKKE